MEFMQRIYRSWFYSIKNPLFLSAIIYLFRKNAFESYYNYTAYSLFFYTNFIYINQRLFNAEKINSSGFIFLFSPAIFFITNIIEVVLFCFINLDIFLF